LLGGAIKAGDLHLPQVRTRAKKQPVISAIISAGGLKILDADADTETAGIERAKSLGPANRPFIRAGQPGLVINLTRIIGVDLRKLQFVVGDVYVGVAKNDPIGAEGRAIEIIRPHRANVRRFPRAIGDCDWAGNDSVEALSLRGGLRIKPCH